ncbi:EAL domain-containing protein [Rhodospirillum centenum]|uniref:Diguanylate phosphodiesterase (EAL) domain protein n=1 Tax=Rhodospirillum centenum (strain ATCC 51521 / SW) TaxID=414684 RepID=B6IW58_RHOCS|nr:EAL domain-containing protein [Rhodospirillum centenum]ACJ00532.1 diguanylate phosphodiesterase (EAL) domain protein [Rhodospirillum centenum SW]
MNRLRTVSWLRHAVFAFAYAALALAVALTLSLTVAGVDRDEAVLFGLLTFVFGALLHEFWSRTESQERLEARMWRLQRQQDEIRVLLARLDERLSGTVPLRGEVASIVSEARLLERLAGQLPPQPPAGAVSVAAVPVGEAPLADTPAGVDPADAPDGGPAPEPPRDLFTPRPAPRMPPAPLTPAPLTAAPPQPAGPDDAAVLDSIRRALRADQVDIFLQPIVSLPQRKHRYYEVFSRIRDGGGETYLTPDRYLAVAERAGLIAAIDNMLLFRCIQLIRETEKRHQTVGFMCNISAATLNDSGFMGEFVQYMGQHPNLAAKLVFELSQADLMQGGLFATGFLDGLKRLGFRFSMDQVERLDVDWDEMARHEIRYVKLDAARLLDPDGRFADPRAVRELKNKLDRNAIDLIVEKVETDQQLLELLDLYIDFGQGYLFGEPRLAKKPAG